MNWCLSDVARAFAFGRPLATVRKLANLFVGAEAEANRHVNVRCELGL
jgi:hypothetical protein